MLALKALALVLFVTSGSCEPHFCEQTERMRAAARVLSRNLSELGIDAEMALAFPANATLLPATACVRTTGL